MTRRSGWPTLPVSEWPDPDREAWQAAQDPGGPLDAGGSAAELAPRTRGTMQKLYGQFLFWLRERGRLHLAAGPGDRMTHEVYLAYLAERRASVSDNVVFNNLRMLAMMLKCLAPAKEWGWLYRHRRAPRRHEAAAARRPVTIVQPGVLLARLQAAITQVLTEPVGRASAIRLRDLLMVAVTTTSALRMRNIRALTLGESVLPHRHGYEIRFPANAVKNARPISMLVMSELTEALDRYVEAYRPLLLAGRGDAGGALWVSNEGRRLSEPSAYAAFVQVTAAVLGRKVNPHAMRHSAATAFLGSRPLDIETASAVLAHGDPATIDRFYDMSGDDAARRIWGDLVGKYRKRREPG